MSDFHALAASPSSFTPAPTGFMTFSTIILCAYASRCCHSSAVRFVAPHHVISVIGGTVHAVLPSTFAIGFLIVPFRYSRRPHPQAASVSVVLKAIQFNPSNFSSAGSRKRAGFDIGFDIKVRFQLSFGESSI